MFSSSALVQIKSLLTSEGGSRNFLGIEFAPLKVTLKRRLQTLGAAFVVVVLISGFITTLVSWYVILFTKYWPVAVLYWIWIYLDKETAHKAGRKFRSCQKWKIWKWACEYFPIKLIKTAEMPADKNYLMCVYPHGILSISSFLSFCTDANDFSKLYPGIDPYRITLDCNFNCPITREIYLATGNCASSERSIINLLEKDKPTACVLIVGGAAESVLAYPGSYRIILNRRKGFIRLALQTGSALVPVLSFGENNMYDQITNKWIQRVQEIIRNITTVSLVLLMGRGFFQYTFGIVPRRTPINTIVGKPIDVPKVENPSKELINEYKEKFVTELKNLFETHKGKYDKLGSKAELIIQ